MKPLFTLGLILAFLFSALAPLSGSAQATFDCSMVSEIPLLECEALLALYNSTNGPNWKFNYNWLETNTPSDWFGVSVASGHVVELVLYWNQLSGTLPVELGNLSSLQQLDLSYGKLSGSIPAELGQLSSLWNLQLVGDGLSGSIPPELGDLSALQWLNLAENKLSGGIPTELGDLSNLLGLDLSANYLDGEIPAELGNPSGLVELSLYDNRFSSSLPPELGNLSDLNHLYLYNNLLSGAIPPELGNLTSLYVLDLSDNRLSGPIPPQLGGMLSLIQLTLDNNQLSGPLPPELSNLIALERLSLFDNCLDGSIPAELSKLSNLTELSLADNQLSGSIPVEMADMQSLAWLDLSDNLLSGSIPPLGRQEPTIWHLLRLSGNQLSGAIPPQLGSLIYLQELDLSHNQLSRSIPTELGNFSYIQILRLDQNQLSGDVPESLINLDDLYDPGGAPDGGDGLDLDYNMLSVPPGYPDPTNSYHAFLFQKDPEWHFLQGFEQVIGNAGGVLTSLDGRTSFDIPAGALITDTAFTFMPQPVPGYSPANLAFARNSFQLSALDSSGNPLITFTLPVTATLSYTDTDIASIFEDTLGLYYWDDSWLDALSTCTEGAYTRDPQANTFALPVCHLSEFAVLGETLQFFIPLALVQR